MKIAKIVASLFFVSMSACVSLDEAGRAYFRSGSTIKGVEPQEALLARMKEDQKLRDIIYGQAKSAKIVQCTVLRNQLYVASAKGNRSKEIMDAVKLMENAYQQDDESFLRACDEISSTNVGKTFLRVQQEHLMAQPNN